MVLELTLKHVKALTNLIDQQQQKIMALQSGLQAGEYLCLAVSSLESSSTNREPVGSTSVVRNIVARSCLCTLVRGRGRFLSFLKGQTFYLECCCVPPGTCIRISQMIKYFCGILA